jgi:hypothetical protein
MAERVAESAVVAGSIISYLPTYLPAYGTLGQGMCPRGCLSLVTKKGGLVHFLAFNCQ